MLNGCRRAVNYILSCDVIESLTSLHVVVSEIGYFSDGQLRWIKQSCLQTSPTDQTDKEK